MRKGKSKKSSKSISMPVVNAHAAGVDIGSKEHYACVAQDNVEKFGVCTEDLHAICRYFLNHKIETVALESTGFYWKPLFVLLQDYGFEVVLVNARHIKNVKGHKTDVVDSKWLQLLHSIGLLSNSFQPDIYTAILRTYTRHRKSLVSYASRYISVMNKVLVSMNIQLSNVLRDISGKSGSRIIEAILDGERDPKILARLVSGRIKASPEEVEKALVGDWREEYLFELRHAYELYQHYWKKIAETDRVIAQHLEGKEPSEVDRNDFNPIILKGGQKNDPKVDITGHAYEMSNGTDLSQIPGVGLMTLLTLMSEVGMDLSAFPSPKHFVSWLGLSPNNKISGGKLLSSKTRKKTNQLALALKDAANAAGNSQTRLGDFFRNLAFRKGRSVAIIAVARKIATIIYAMLRDGTPYSYEYSIEDKAKQKGREVKKLIKKMNHHDISIHDLSLIIN